MTDLQIASVEAAPFIVLLVGLALTVLTDSYISRSHKRILLIVVLLTITLIIQNVASSVLENAPYVVVRKLLSIYGYSVRPAIIVLFCYFIKNRKGILPAWCLVGLKAALYLTALFSPLTFTFTEPYYAFARGPLGYASHMIGAILLVWLLVRAICEFRDDKKEMIFPIVSILFISAGVLLDALLPIWKLSALSALTISIVISCIFVYYFFHVQFVRNYQDRLITQQRINTMVSQIQPHFLYNTIATFRALCKTDPDKAAVVAEKFGRYLRQNLDLAESNNLIPIEKEIEHTKVYSDIEKVRLENVHIEYDIRSLSEFCASNQIDDEKRNAGLTTPAGIQRFDDVRYGEDERNVLDVYRPKDAAGRLPVIVSIHGGGWVYGNKEIMSCNITGTSISEKTSGSAPAPPSCRAYISAGIRSSARAAS